MKIAIVGPAHPFRGGIADTNQALAMALQAQGHRVKIFTFTVQYPDFLFPGKTQLTDEKGPESLEIERSIHSLNPLSWHKTAKAIKTFGAEEVFIRFWIPFMSPAFSAIAKRVGKKARVTAICDNALPHEKRFGDKALTLRFFNRVDRVVTLSCGVASQVEELTKKPVVPLFHPINPLPPAVSRGEALRKLGLDSEVHYVLFFGLIRAYKGLDLLLKAFAEKSLEQSNVKLLIAGEFYDDKQKYTELISELGIQDRVVVHAGFVAAADIPYYFSVAELVAQTYYNASQSGITPMAIHYLVPSLVTTVGGLVEYVDHAQTGWEVAISPFAIATKIAFHFSHDQSHMKGELQKQKYALSWDLFAKKILD